jgi:hypothetical protein
VSKEKFPVWVVTRVKDYGPPMDWEINGVFSSVESALAHCDENSAAALFFIGEDMRDETRFFIATLANPAGAWTDNSTASMETEMT